MKLLRLKLSDQLHARLRRMAASEVRECDDNFVSAGTMQSIGVRALTRLVDEHENQNNPRPSVQNERAK